jgi:membrane associated rhomboid family serine protease
MFPLKDTIPSHSPPLMTWALLLVNAGVFFFELQLSDAQLDQLFYLFGLVPARYSHPGWAHWVGLSADDYWPFLTCMFLHGGWFHFIGNMWTLWIFGDNVEDRMGPARFLIFYLLCGLAASVVHYLTNWYSAVPTVGASGAIAGVMGAYFLLYPRARIIMLLPIFFYPFFFEIPAVLYLGVWFYSQLLGGMLSIAGPAQVGGIAVWAHVGGFLAGAVLRGVFVRPDRPIQDDEYGLESAFMRV